MATYQRTQGWTDRPRQDAPTVTVNTDVIRLKESPANLFSDVAESTAIEIAKYRSDRMNNSTQLRRFYDELVMWFERVQFQQTPAKREEKYEDVAPFIQMLIAKVAYAKGRGHVDANFDKFFAHLIRQIENVKTLQYAKLFMEAFMGFYKAEEKK